MPRCFICRVAQDLPCGEAETQPAGEDVSAIVMVVMYKDKGIDGAASFRREHPRWQGACVNANWLLDSASNYCIQPISQYTV